MRPKIEEKEQARLLRKEGMSVPNIALKLGVAKSSVSSWVRDIKLTEGQLQTFKDNRIKAAKLSFRPKRENSIERYRALRKQYQEEGKQYALNNNDPLHLAGCMLYWAEGAKSRTGCILANTDPYMIKLFKEFLDKTFNIEQTKYTVRLNFYIENGSQREIEDYWLSVLDLPRSCLRKHTIKTDANLSKRKMKKNKYPYGICSFGIYSVEVIQHIYGALQVYAGLPEDYGLDFK